METKFTEKELKAICQYILNSLKRVAPSVSEVNYEIKGKYIHFKTNSFNTFPTIFKSVFIEGTMVENIKEEYNECVVSLHYKWRTFTGGTNGTDLGKMYFRYRPKAYTRIVLEQDLTLTNQEVIYDDEV